MIGICIFATIYLSPPYSFNEICTGTLLQTKYSMCSAIHQTTQDHKCVSRIKYSIRLSLPSSLFGFIQKQMENEALQGVLRGETRRMMLQCHLTPLCLNPSTYVVWSETEFVSMLFSQSLFCNVISAELACCLLQ